MTENPFWKRVLPKYWRVPRPESLPRDSIFLPAHQQTAISSIHLVDGRLVESGGGHPGGGTNDELRPPTPVPVSDDESISQDESLSSHSSDDDMEANAEIVKSRNKKRRKTPTINVVVTVQLRGYPRSHRRTNIHPRPAFNSSSQIAFTIPLSPSTIASTPSLSTAYYTTRSTIPHAE